MAGRVNTKFVVVLSVVLVAAFAGVAAMGYTVLKARPARWVAKADALAAAGQYAEASELYERAVGHDRTRLEWIEKWRDALVKTTPDNRARYEAKYDFYRNILRQIAFLKPKDGAAQLAYIEEVDRMVRAFGGSREGLSRLIREITERLQDLDPDDPAVAALRRYRGAAVVDQMFLIRLEEADRIVGREDLEAAIRADRGDVLARTSLARWYGAEAERLRVGTQSEEAVEAIETANRLIAELEQEYPDRADVLLAGFLVRQAERLRSMPTSAERLKAIEQMRAEALHVVDVALDAPRGSLPAGEVDRIVGVVLRMVGPDAVAPLLSLVDRSLEEHPNDARLLLSRGVILQTAGRLEEAIAQFQKVIDLPDLPVSLEGLLLPGQRTSAMAYQVDCAIAQWNEAVTDQERDAALARAKAFRANLSANAGVRGRDVVLLRDAKIAFAERRYDQTVAALSELRGMGTGPTRSLEVLQILAQALRQQQNLGEARLVLQELIELAPSHAWAHAQLGEVNALLGRPEDAIRNFEAASRLEPANESYTTRVKTLRTALGMSEAGEADPIVLALIEVERIRESGDLIRARERLEALEAEYPNDRRIFRRLIELDTVEGLRDVALQRVEAKLAEFPNDEELMRLKVTLTTTDPVEAALAIIDAAAVPPAIKAVERFRVFIQANRPDEAEAALAEAQRLDPENPTVLDVAFVAALGKQDFETAQKLAQTAARLDVDQLGGLLYVGRLQLIEGEGNPERLRAAVRTFEDAVKRVPYNPMVRKLLAQAYTRVGRLPDAVEAYKRALEGKPDDLVTARDLIRTLRELNRGPEALEVASPTTGILRFHPSNRELLSIWMDLEARHGDRAKAIRAREEFHRLEPENHLNTAALATLYLEDRRWDDAEFMIRQLEKSDPNVLRVAALRANLLAFQGDVDGGIKALQTHINDDMPAAQKTVAYLGLADFLRANQRYEEAAAAMRKARETQTPTIMEADRALGDLFFDLGSARSQEASIAEDGGQPEVAAELRRVSDSMLREAIASYEAVLEAVKDNPKDRELLLKRMCETYLRLREFDRALTLVGELAKSQPDDMQVLLLQGAIAAGKGERRTARQFYDRAVALNAANPNAYFQRALFNLTTADAETRKALFQDILQDLEQVTKLKPSLSSAWMRRHALLREAGRADDAMRVLREAIQANPTVDVLRMTLIRDLAMAGRYEEMQSELVRAADERPEDARWLRLAAHILMQPGIQRYRDAAQLLERYYVRVPGADVAGELLDAWLRPENSPTAKRVQELLADFEPAYQASLLHHVMLKARARAFTGQNDLAERHLREALELVGNSGPRAHEFLSYLILARGGVPGAIDWLKDKAKAGPINPFLMTVVLSARRTEERPAVIAESLRELLPRATDDVTRVEVLKTLSAVCYSGGMFKEAAEASRQALAILENDPNRERNPAYLETLNNLAYTLVSQLDSPSEALPFAQRAAELHPTSATVLDTLGWVYHKMGDHNQAVAVLGKAAQMSRDPDENFITQLHLGLAQAAAGDRSSARRALEQAEALADRVATGRQPEYKAQLESLRRAVE